MPDYKQEWKRALCEAWCEADPLLHRVLTREPVMSISGQYTRAHWCPTKSIRFISWWWSSRQYCNSYQALKVTHINRYLRNLHLHLHLQKSASAENCMKSDTSEICICRNLHVQSDVAWRFSGSFQLKHLKLVKSQKLNMTPSAMAELAIKEM